MRECGLKHNCKAYYYRVLSSLPVRECGLKQFGTNPPKTHVKVTPRAGVWIEMQSSVSGAAGGDVSPRAGGWIETITHALFPLLNAVTPRAGVWIETSNGD